MSYMEGEDQNNKEQHFSTILLGFQDTCGNMILKDLKSSDVIINKWKCDWNYNSTKLKVGQVHEFIKMKWGRL